MNCQFCQKDRVLFYSSAMLCYSVFSAVFLIHYSDSSFIITKSMIHAPGEISKGIQYNGNNQSGVLNESSTFFFEPVRLNPNGTGNVTNTDRSTRGRSITKLYPVNKTETANFNKSIEELNPRNAKSFYNDTSVSDRSYNIYNDNTERFQISMTKLEDISPTNKEQENYNIENSSQTNLYHTFWNQLKNLSVSFIARAACDVDNSQCEEQFTNTIYQGGHLNLTQMLRSTEVKLQILSLVTNVYNCFISYGPRNCFLRVFCNDDLECFDKEERDAEEEDEDYEDSEVGERNYNIEEERKKGSVKVNQKLIQPLLLLLLKMKIFIIPIVAGLALISGKALSFSFFALILSVLLGSTHRISDMWHGAMKRHEIQPQQHDYQYQTPTDYYMR